METAKDIFFFVGSILGIAGFISSVIQPFLNDNREKWNQIAEIFDDNFFRGLETVYTRRSVSQDQFDKLWRFLDEVRENKDYLRMKFPCRKLFSHCYVGSNGHSKYMSIGETVR